MKFKQHLLSAGLVAASMAMGAGKQGVGPELCFLALLDL
jgi:hypothetical protein